MKRELCRNLFRVAILLLLFCTSRAVASAQKYKLDEASIQRARRYESIIADSAARHGVDGRILWVIAYLETGFNPGLVSRKGARGLMQFMPETAQMFGLTDPHDPISAIDAAARYVRFLASRFNNRADLVLAAYNSGETVVEAYLTGRSIKVGNRLINPKGIVTGGIPPYRETQDYVVRGLKLLADFPPNSILHSQKRISHSKDVSVIEETMRQNNLVRKSIRPHLEPPAEESRIFKNRRSICYVKVTE